MRNSTLDLATDRLLFPVRQDVQGRDVLWRGIRDFRDAALDLVFPPHCVSCQAPMDSGINKALCRHCALKIQWIGEDRCARCGDGVGLGSGVVRDCPSCRTHPPAYVSSSCALAKYAEGPLRDLILAMKFSARFHVARTLGDALAQRIQALKFQNPNMVLVPAPLTRVAAYRRGFNQAEELALCISRRLKIPVDARLLAKIRSTPTQATLTREKRRTNLRGAFVCNSARAARYKNGCALVIDDVITTGSTISECARILTEAGIPEVRAAAVARG